MKLYESLSADVTMSDYGTSWLILMSGPKQEVDWVFNAFYNFGATNETRFNWDENQQVGTFYSTKARVTKFFKNFWENRLVLQNKIADEAANLAAQSVEDLFQNHRRARRQYKSSPSLSEEGAGYEVGTIRAEKPDASFQDAVLEYAFAPKDSVKSEVEEMFNELQ